MHEQPPSPFSHLLGSPALEYILSQHRVLLLELWQNLGPEFGIVHVYVVVVGDEGGLGEVGGEVERGEGTLE
jgi:hypothetical protein